MRTRAQKWGNSLAVRIPKSFAAETGIAQDSVVEVSVEKGKITIAPLAQPTFTLEELLAGVTPENCHPEFDTGLPTGKEAL